MTHDNTAASFEGQFRFTVGDVKCLAVSDGAVTYPADAIYPGVSPEERASEAGVESENIDVPYTCLVIQTDGRTILVDTGMGEGVVPGAGTLHQNLAAANLDTESIDTVVLTHGHPDHIGGLTGEAGTLLFPNARYVMSETDWQFWTSPDLESKLTVPEPFHTMLTSFARRHLPAISERIELAGDGFEVAKGVSLVSAPGHTPGHAGLEVHSKGECLLAAADAIVHHGQFAHPDWHVVPDFDASAAATTRRRLLDRAATERFLLMGYHLPFPALGHANAKGSAWEWEPLNITP